ncbi:MAG: EamA family transporter [Patescibacteria group bacterium]|jgi:drug/metabolite transporter (DMT)-like permease
MLWFVFALVPTLSDALANILDGRLSNGYFRKPFVQLFYAEVVGIIFLPLLFLYRLPQSIDLPTAAWFFCITLLDILCLLFYLRALQHTDTSIVASLFSIGKIFVPILAFFFIGERLSPFQYLAFIIIITCASLLTTNHAGGKFVVNRALFLMIVSSLAHSVSAIIYKHVLEHLDWVTALTYFMLFSFGIMMILGALQWRAVREHWQSFLGTRKIFFANSALAFGSGIGSVLAYSLAPVTLVKAVFSIQPIFVLGYTLLLRKRFPGAFREQFDRKNITKKLLLFAVIMLMLILIAE